MDQFKYTLELSELNRVKTKTALRKLVTKYRSAYDVNYRVEEPTTYCINSKGDNTILDKIKYNHLLYLRALERFKELETDHDKLALYMKYDGNIHLNVTPTVAVKILELLKEQNGK